jgi:hypothetical protein
MIYASIEQGLFLIFTYFTTFPQNLYIQANKNSNLPLTGIGLGLIYNQRIFWISNISLGYLIYNKNNNIFLISNLNSFYFLYSSIQFLLYLKTIYLLKLLKGNIK